MTTQSAPIPTRTSVSARPGVLVRWKLTEPARLYLYGLAVVAVLGLTMAGVLTGEWSHYWLTAAGVVLGIVPATEAVRASVYSPAGMLTAVNRAATPGLWDGAR